MLHKQHSNHYGFIIFAAAVLFFCLINSHAHAEAAMTWDSSNWESNWAGDEIDSDNDNVADASDNCPLIANNQSNNDGDSYGDACDSDDDNDGVNDEAELAKGTNPYLTDSDGDGKPDNTDAFPTDEAPYSSTEGFVTEVLKIKGCKTISRSSNMSFNYLVPEFNWLLNSLTLTGNASGNDKKLAASLDGTSQYILVNNLAEWSGCNIKSMTSQKISLAINKKKNTVKLTAKIGIAATVTTAKGKITQIKGSYDIKANLPWQSAK